MRTKYIVACLIAVSISCHASEYDSENSVSTWLEEYGLLE